MKFENNWKYKSLEQLEKNFWKAPVNASYLIMTCHELRKKKLNEFVVEDIRIIIGQEIGIKFLIPLAIKQLKKDILAEADYYPGDFLETVLTSSQDYWKKNIFEWSEVCQLIEQNSGLIERS